jgi:hypothetical protein
MLLTPPLLGLKFDMLSHVVGSVNSQDESGTPGPPPVLQISFLLVLTKAL